MILPFLVFERQERGVESLEGLAALATRRRRRVKAVAATAAAIGGKIPDRHVGVGRRVHLLEREELPGDLDAVVAELAIDLSQPGRGTMDIRTCEIEVHVYGNAIAHERSFCAGSNVSCISFAGADQTARQASSTADDVD